MFNSLNNSRQQQKLFEIVQINGELLNFDGDFRYALSLINDIEDTMNDGVMTDTFSEGERRLITEGKAEGIVAGPEARPVKLRKDPLEGSFVASIDEITVAMFMELLFLKKSKTMQPMQL